MMKFVRKLLLVLLVCGIVIPAYSAPAKEKKTELPSSLECPGCGKKVKLNKKKDKKSSKKKKKSKKSKKDKKKKDKEVKKADKPVKIICPKCKKEIPIPGQEKPAAEEKPEKKTDAPETPETPETPDTPEDQPADQE